MVTWAWVTQDQMKWETREGSEKWSDVKRCYVIQLACYQHKFGYRVAERLWGKGGSRKEEAPAAIRARDDGGLDQGGRVHGGRSDPILDVFKRKYQLRFADGLDMSGLGKEESSSGKDEAQCGLTDAHHTPKETEQASGFQNLEFRREDWAADM